MAEDPKKKKCRQYNVEYLKYGFIPAPHNPQMPFCLLCERSFSNEAMKPSRLMEHMKKTHSTAAHKDVAYFKSIRDKRQGNTLQSLFAQSDRRNDDGLRASYNIALLIAKAGKPHNIGETLIVPALNEVITTVMKKDPALVL